MDSAGWRLPLGSFVLDLRARELLDAAGKPAALRRQGLNLLLALGDRAGKVVGKDELMTGLWPTVVVGEGSLTQAVADVRRALGDADHRLVRNVARRGYLLQPGPRFDGAPADEQDVAGLSEEAPLIALAVLPFAVEGPAGAEDWFAGALHDDLLSDLTRLLPGHVIGRGSVIGYDGRTVDPRRVARELKVRHVVRGALYRDEDRVRVNVAMIDGDRGVQRWADTFVIERSNLPKGLADLALRLARELHMELCAAVDARHRARTPVQVTADELAMRATAHWCGQLTAAKLREVVARAEEALALDDGCARAWHSLATARIQLLNNGWITDRDAVHADVDRAVERLQLCDPQGRAHFQVRVIQAFLRQDFARMLRLASEFAQRDRLPMNFGTHGYALLLNGRADEAVVALATAIRLSPREAMLGEWQYRLAFAHFMAGRDDLASEWAQSAALSGPALSWPPVQSAALAALGDLASAREALAEHLTRHPDFRREGRQQIARRLPGRNAAVAQARDRLCGLLEGLGVE